MVRSISSKYRNITNIDITITLTNITVLINEILGLIEVETFFTFLSQENATELPVLRLVGSDHLQGVVDYLPELGFDWFVLHDLEGHDRLFQQEVESLVTGGE